MKKDRKKENLERCVLCGALTQIPATTPITLRACYEVGCGQLCYACYKKLYRTSDAENVLSDEQIMLAVEESRKENA